MASKVSYFKGFQNAAYLSVGTFLSQIIGFVGLLFIARLLGPNDYGIYATVFAFVSFFHLFVLNGLSKIVVREGSKQLDSFSHVLDKTIGLRLVLVGAALLFCIFASFFTNYSAQIKVLIILFSAEIIYFGLDSFLGAIYQTKQKMEYLSYFSVLTRFLVTSLSIAFLYMGAGVAVILVVNLVSKLIVLCVNYSVSKKFVKFHWSLRWRLEPVILKAVIVFSLMGFINTFAVRIDVLMISFLSNSTDVGLYSVAHELGREGLILRNIIAVAFFPIAVKYFVKQKVKTKKIMAYSLGFFILAFIGSMVVFFFAEKIILLLFKEKYMASGMILKYLVFYLPFTFFSLPFSTCLQATHNENVLLMIYSITAVVNIPLNVIFFYRFGLIGIAYSTIIVFFVEAVLISILSLIRLRRQGYLVK